LVWAREDRTTARAKTVFLPSRMPLTRERSARPVGSLASRVHVRPGSASAWASSGNVSETCHTGTIPSRAGTGRGAGPWRGIDTDGSYANRARWIAGPPANTPTRPGSTGRFSSPISSAGVSRSATYTSARVPAKTTRIVNQSPMGNEIGAQKPGPWYSCQLEIPLKTGVYWIASGFPT
jgi:hypothetical protein